MRKRLTRAVIALTLAITVTATGTIKPAPAQAGPVRVQYDIIAIIGAVKTLVDIWRSFRGGGMSIEAATQQILGAINTAKTDILSHMDRLAAAEARSCATRHVIELADIQQFNPTTMQIWAQDATGCVTLISSLLDVVTDKAAADTLGAAFDVIGPIALIARSRAGFSTEALRAVLVSGNNKIITKLMPDCYFVSGWNPPYITRSICIAYNGDRAEQLNTYPNDALRAQAMQRTSWVIAQYAIPLL
ncbi:hypothetical protein [Actinophytocola sp.]|uniref:hypothetical protein n=1 Tax=Actinophytocola sp. TaxID=1872138 RepID=UPI002D80236C|nr:hypothetical protein [Actinophytocola sp.]HET9141462.1 hypothetical protein [Actinophytocola sp.]HEU5109538.1 hypothetical protein [Micromonosporaceae bacterium]